MVCCFGCFCLVFLVLFLVFSVVVRGIFVFCIWSLNTPSDDSERYMRSFFFMLSGMMRFLRVSPWAFMAETTLEREQPSLSAMFWMVKSVSSRNCKVSRSRSSGIWFQ